MKSQGIDDVIRQAEHISVGEQENYNIQKPEVDRKWLTMLLEGFFLYFQERAEKNDMEALIFCLHHLYCCIDDLYQSVLPALTTSTAEQQSGSMLSRRYRTWTHLREMQHSLEQIESLYHLLLGTATHILARLDSTSGEKREAKEDLSSLIETEQWQQAYDALTANLHAWQEHNEKRLSFSNIFSTMAGAASGSSGSSLIQMDSALTLLLDSASAIFGDIVPDFQAVSQGDDEVAATLLFDLMQQVDLQLLQNGTLLELLQELIKRYTIVE